MTSCIRRCAVLQAAVTEGDKVWPWPRTELQFFHCRNLSEKSQIGLQYLPGKLTQFFKPECFGCPSPSRIQTGIFLTSLCFLKMGGIICYGEHFIFRLCVKESKRNAWVFASFNLTAFCLSALGFGMEFRACQEFTKLRDPVVFFCTQTPNPTIIRMDVYLVLFTYISCSTLNRQKQQQQKITSLLSF